MLQVVLVPAAYASKPRRWPAPQLSVMRASGPTPRSASTTPPVSKDASDRRLTVAKFGVVTKRRETSPLESRSVPSAAPLVRVAGVDGLPTRKSSEGKRLSEASSMARGILGFVVGGTAAVPRCAEVWGASRPTTQALLAILICSATSLDRYKFSTCDMWTVCTVHFTDITRAPWVVCRVPLEARSTRCCAGIYGILLSFLK